MTQFTPPPPPPPPPPHTLFILVPVSCQDSGWSCICVSGIDCASYYDLVCALQLFRQSCAFYYDNPHLY